MFSQIAVALSLLALTGGLFLLAKTNKDSLGMAFKLVSWIVILFSFLVFLCSVVQGFQKMFRHHDHMENCGKEMMNCHEHGGMMGKDCCKMGMDNCEHVGGMKDCDMQKYDNDTVITESRCCKMANGDSMKIEKRIEIKTR